MDNPRLIDANVLRKRIEERIQEFDKETSAASAFMGYDLDDVLDYIDTTPTIALETDAQYWHNPETDPPKVETEVLIFYEFLLKSLWAKNKKKSPAPRRAWTCPACLLKTLSL